MMRGPRIVEKFTVRGWRQGDLMVDFIFPRHLVRGNSRIQAALAGCPENGGTWPCFHPRSPREGVLTNFNNIYCALKERIPLTIPGVLADATSA